MSTPYYCVVFNPRANAASPILNMSTLENQVVPTNSIVKRIYVCSDISSSAAIKVGSQVNDELVIPLSANVRLSLDLKGCMYNPTLIYSVNDDTPLYLTLDGDVDGVVKVMVEIESLDF